MSDKIDLSSYTIQKKWIEEIAPNYFNVEDINMLKAGLFGYINEVFSNSFEDSLHMQTIMSKEVFPNKAVLPDSIYAYSALADFTDFYAVPSTVSMVLAIRKKDVIDNSVINPISKYLELYISKYSTLTIGGKISFILDYDIKIISRYNNNDYIMSAQYIMDEKNELSDVNTPYINTVVLADANEEYIYLNLKVRQLERTVISNLVYTNDITENISFDAEYKGRLAGFNVYYKPNSYLDEKILLDKYLVNSILPDDDSKFCMYSISSTDKISISFSSHPSYFRPAFNSELIIEVFTTLGEEGNFTYNGEENTVKLLSTNEDKDLSDINAFCQVQDDAKGGKNEPDLATIKQKVIKEFSMRKNIITESDLNNYFKDRTENCDIYFCKKRDDIIKRIYTAFMLLRNDKDEVIPTNTVDIAIYQDQVDNYVKNSPTYTIKAGTIFEGTEGTSTFNKSNVDPSDWMELVSRDSNLSSRYPASIADKRTNYLYGTPFLIKINSSPLFMSYYLNSIYDKILLNYSYMNNSSYEEFIMTNLNVTRNAIKENYYTLDTYINTTLDTTRMFETYGGNDNLIIDYAPGANHVDLYGIIEENGVTTGYIKFEPYKADKNRIYYRAILETDDYINTEDKLNIINSIYAPNNNVENLRANFALSNDAVTIHMCIYYNGYEFTTKEKFLKDIPNMNDFALCNIYRTETNLQLFKNLNSIMNSAISMRVSENGSHPGYYYKLRKVPMIRYMYMENEENMRDIVNKLDNLKDVLMECLPLMENNFNLDAKFYNTYGESKYFTIGRRKEVLNMVSISITLNIKLTVEVTSDLIKELKTYIANFVESTNDSNTSFLYISNLIRNLEQEFDEIVYIEFVSFNDYDSSKQIIENNFTDLSGFTKQQIIDFVPEYLNINRHIVLDTGELVFEPRIFLNFI